MSKAIRFMAVIAPGRAAAAGCHAPLASTETLAPLVEGKL